MTLTFVKTTPGGRHAWYESNVGLVRKPYPKLKTAEGGGD